MKCCSFDFAHIICTNFLYGSKDWVPADVIAKCKVTLEFCCAEKQPGNSSSINEGRMPYMWCGQLRRTIDLSDKNEDQDKSHSVFQFIMIIYMYSIFTDLYITRLLLTIHLIIKFLFQMT